MRLLYPLFSWLLQYSLVNGFAQAPGIYPADEMKESDLTVPKNPYQSGWTGYEYYYEKDGAKKGSSTTHSTSEGGGGKTKSGSDSSKPVEMNDNELEVDDKDRENGEDPGYSEPSRIPTAQPTSSNNKVETEVSPSSTTGMYYETTNGNVSSTTNAPKTTNTNHPPGTEPAQNPPSVDNTPQTGGDDLSAIDNGIGYDIEEGKSPTKTSPTSGKTNSQPSKVIFEENNIETSTSTSQTHHPSTTTTSTTKSAHPPTAPQDDSPYGDVGKPTGYSFSSTAKNSETKSKSNNQPSGTKIQGIKLVNPQPMLLLTSTTAPTPTPTPTPTPQESKKLDNFESEMKKKIEAKLEWLSKTIKMPDWEDPTEEDRGFTNFENSTTITPTTATTATIVTITAAITTTTKPPSSQNSMHHFPIKPMYFNKNNKENNTEPIFPFSPPLSLFLPRDHVSQQVAPSPSPSPSHPLLSFDTISSNSHPPSSPPPSPRISHSLAASPSLPPPPPPPSPPSQLTTIYKPRSIEFIKGFKDEKAYESGIDNISSIGQGNQIGDSSTDPQYHKAHSSHDSFSHNTHGHSPSFNPSPSTPNPIPTLIPNYSNQDFGDYVGGYPDKDTAAFNKQPRRESVDYGHQEVTGDSTKDVVVETSVKKLSRSARKCCSCCDEKQPVNREIQTEIEPSENVQQIVDATGMTSEYQNEPENGQIGENTYVQQQPQVQTSQPVTIPQEQGYNPLPLAPQTYAQHPFQQYQPQYPQSYPQQSPGCPCQVQQVQQNCCPPPQPCCMPQIPCCPTIPCCPSRTICCQPQPVCPPPPTCCQINFQLPTIPICGRSCPSCPCRRRVHKARRLKRHSLGGSCNQCSRAGEPWKSVVHREKRFATGGCSGGLPSFLQSSCGQCGSSNLRSARVKRMGCLPCLGRKKRETEEEEHVRVKRMGCLPCLGRKKRSAGPSNCSSCSNLGQIFGRYKRSLFGGCSPCRQKREVCPCQSAQSQLTRGKRDITVMKSNKRTLAVGEVCDSSCCDYTTCQKQKRLKKDTLVPFM